MQEVSCVLLSNSAEALVPWLKSADSLSNDITLLRFSRFHSLDTPAFYPDELSLLERLYVGIPEDERMQLLERLSYRDYVLAALYKNLFTRVHLFKEHMTQTTQNLFVHTAPKEKPYELFISEAEQESDQSLVYEVGESIAGVKQSEDICFVDVDVTYFYVQQSPRFEQEEIRITETAAKEYRENPYHILRLLSGGNLLLEERAGNYFLRLVGNEAEAPDIGTIQEEKVRKVVESISSLGDKVHLVTFSRNEASGYVPASIAKALQEMFLNMLSAKCSLSVQTSMEFV